MENNLEDREGLSWEAAAKKIFKLWLQMDQGPITQLDNI